MGSRTYIATSIATACLSQGFRTIRNLITITAQFQRLHGEVLLLFLSLPSVSSYQRSNDEFRSYLQKNWHPGISGAMDCGLVRRIGPAGDGGKAICLDSFPSGVNDPCFVLSVGVGGLPNQPPDFGFEEVRFVSYLFLCTHFLSKLTSTCRTRRRSIK